MYSQNLKIIVSYNNFFIVNCIHEYIDINLVLF